MSGDDDRLTHRPFSNGTEYGMWSERNCERCAKGYACNDGVPSFDAIACEIERALAIASISDGEIDGRIARRLGCQHNDLGYPSRMCPEFRPTGGSGDAAACR